eukprot:Lithocolla_globosa_v1_NODE_7936_length_885_cov_4.549398.p1 type:complete len:193 gc:universal NODE_7936_length_885_cov_4.549398:277-855(+)
MAQARAQAGAGRVVLLDLCCGTGTIGITLANKVDAVVGVELVSQAVKDAEENAKINGLTNTTYICARVEKVIDEIISKNKDATIVAIVDPPRAGLHGDVTRTLRACSKLDYLLYVSCDPAAASGNFVDLMRPATKKLSGLPFEAIVGQPVDLFPSTRHCELVIAFRRIKDDEIAVSNKVDVEKENEEKEASV